MATFTLLRWLSLLSIAYSARKNRKKKEPGAAKPGSAASHHLPIEAHHSLQRPFDVSMPYWKYGGSTVATESFIRLTPDRASRAGWLFNEFELQSAGWEIELHFSVSAKSGSHLGGDGMALWVLADAHHPRRNKKHNYLSGSVMGITEKFQGLGVILDTFDNDADKKNPAVYAIKQEKNNWQTWDHDHDHLANRITEVLDKDDENHCVAHYRNEANHRMIVRYLGGELHVYLKAMNAEEYTFCFSVAVGLETNGYYIALSAMTGEVADKHDVQMLNVRYLDSSDRDSIDDRILKRTRAGGRGRVTVGSVLFWILMVALNGFLLWEVGYEWWQFDKLRHQRMSPVICCQRLNAWIWIAYLIHTAALVFAVLAGRWWYILVNAPFVGWRGYQWMTNNIKLEPIKLRKKKNLLDAGQPFGSLVKFLILSVSAIMSFYNIFAG